MEKLLPSSGEFEKEWKIEFHGVCYEINLGTSSSVLTLDIEQDGTNDKWSAEFTSQYIEEITHKAGNFKKFETFVMMLSSAFARDSDTVYVDLLTYNDLEVMKARKVGSSGGSTNASFQSHGSSSSASSKSQMKRYVILTYNSEFDRVHFPLPLAYEENPTVESLQRTIFRLKRREKERAEEAKGQLVSVKESRDLKFIDAQLRQENTELKHRLRLKETNGGSKRGDDMSSSFNITESAPYLKLKKQVDTLKRALLEKSTGYDKLKAEVMSLRSSAANDSVRGGSRDLQSKVRQLQSMLEMERMDHRKEISRLNRELADTRRASTYGTSRGGSSTASSSSRFRSSRSSPSRESDRRLGQTSSSTARSRASGRVPDQSRSRSPLGDPRPGPPRSARSSGSRGSGSTRGYGESSGYGQFSQARRSSSAGSASGIVRASRSTHSRSPSSAHSSTASRSNPSSRRAASSRSRSPSSSLGGVFDPTAYAREKAEQRSRASESRGRAWGAGGARDRYSRESGYNSASSGYNSATSQSSRGSTGSRRSIGSNRSVNSTYSASGHNEKSVKTTKKSTKKKTGSKSKSPSRKRKTKRDHFPNSLGGIGMKSTVGSSDVAMSSALELHQSESHNYQHHRQDVHEVLGSYLQGHDDSEAELELDARHSAQHQQLQEEHQHNQHQYHQQQHQQHQLQQQQLQLQKHQQSSFSASSSGYTKPPLQQQHRPQYPIDDIEDDSDTDSDTDNGTVDNESKLDSRSELEYTTGQSFGRGSHQGQHIDSNDATGVGSSSAHHSQAYDDHDDVNEVSTLRSHLLHAVTSTSSAHGHPVNSTQILDSSRSSSVRSSTNNNSNRSSSERQFGNTTEESHPDEYISSLEKENHQNTKETSSSDRLASISTSKQKFSSTNTVANNHNSHNKRSDDDGDVSDIDRRLSDLQKFLDKARSGILAVAESTTAE